MQQDNQVVFLTSLCQSLAANVGSCQHPGPTWAQKHQPGLPSCITQAAVTFTPTWVLGCVTQAANLQLTLLEERHAGRSLPPGAKDSLNRDEGGWAKASATQTQGSLEDRSNATPWLPQSRERAGALAGWGIGAGLLYTSFSGALKVRCLGLVSGGLGLGVGLERVRVFGVGCQQPNFAKSHENPRNAPRKRGTRASEQQP